MAARRTTPNRFSDPSASTNGVLSGIQQELDPRFNRGYVKRNLAPFPGLPQNPKKYKGQSDAKLRAEATKAILKQRGITPKKPRKPRKKPAK